VANLQLVLWSRCKPARLSVLEVGAGAKKKHVSQNLQHADPHFTMDEGFW